MRQAPSVPSGIHFALAGILSGVYLVTGFSLLISVPRVLLGLLPVSLLTTTIAAIVYSIVQSIRTVGCGCWVGWGFLLGNCVYAVVVAPIAALHVAVALGV